MCTDDTHSLDGSTVRPASPDPVVAGSSRVAVTVVSDAVVDAHLARLDTDVRRAFVADLWAARGFETTIDDAVVVARHSGESLVVYPVPRRRFRRVRPPVCPVDIVVAFDAVPAWATARDDVRVVAPPDLREMLRYALDPADTESIYRRHLGDAPAALTASLSLRTRQRLDALYGVEESVTVTVVVTLVAVVVLVLAGSNALFAADGTEPLLGAANSSDSFGADVVTPEPTSQSTRAATVSAPPAVGPVDTVPGVGPDGVTNLTALALAHDRELGDSYTLWTDRYRPQNGVPGAPRTQRDTDMTVDGDRYLVEETFETGEERRLVRVVYFDGTDWYVDDRSTDTASVRWVNGSSGDVAPNPHHLRRTLVTRYLATPTTDVTERSYVGRDTRYRLEGEGTPPTFTADVYNYSFVAFVGERGLVHEATVDFTVVTVEGSYRLRFEWTYGEFGAATVTEPAWLHLARPSTPTAPTPSNRTTETTS